MTHDNFAGFPGAQIEIMQLKLRRSEHKHWQVERPTATICSSLPQGVIARYNRLRQVPVAWSAFLVNNRAVVSWSATSTAAHENAQRHRTTFLSR
jgi:hypothetical protein